MKVLSLFDGMSCGQLALQRIGANVTTYFASEIDKYAIQIAKKNFPNTIHLGDVTTIDSVDNIDLLIGGSPCQGFSFAGKHLNFDDPRSKLFFEFVRLLKECKPKYFLLENVVMAKSSQQVISQYLGVEPIEINSSLVSAQHRKRLYWTNIPFEMPDDKKIYLKDILENGLASDKMTKDGKAYCLTARYQGAVWWNSIARKQRTMVLKDKPTVSKNGLNHIGDEVEIVKVRKHEVEIKYLQDCLRQHKKLSERTNKEIAEHLNVPITLVEHWFRTDNSFSIPSEDIWFKLKNYLSIRTTRFDKQITEFEYREGVFESSKRVYHANGKAPTLTATMSGNQKIYTSVDKPISKYGLKQVGIAHLNGHDLLKRVYSSEGKSPTLNAHGGGNTEPKVGEKNLWRKLTPLECERLQTVDDNYTQGVSNTQRYKMIGNGWTIDVVAHILKNITKEYA